jgi:hypothetical protein
MEAHIAVCACVLNAQGLERTVLLAGRDSKEFTSTDCEFI